MHHVSGDHFTLWDEGQIQDLAEKVKQVLSGKLC